MLCPAHSPRGTHASAESQALHSCNKHSKDPKLMLSVGRQMHYLMLSPVLMFSIQSSFPLSEQSWHAALKKKKYPTATISLALSYFVFLMTEKVLLPLTLQSCSSLFFLPVHGYLTVLKMHNCEFVYQSQITSILSKDHYSFHSGVAYSSKDGITSKSELDRSISCETPQLTRPQTFQCVHCHLLPLFRHSTSTHPFLY